MSTESLVTRRVFPDGHSERAERDCLTEHPFDILINERLAYRLVCTREHLKELTYGRLFTDRIIDDPAEVKLFFLCRSQQTATVLLDRDFDPEPAVPAEPTCCSANRRLVEAEGKRPPAPVPRRPIDAAQVFHLTRLFREDAGLHGATGAVHRCILLDPEGRAFSCEDIGRHNAVDKAVGFALLNGVPLSECVLFTSGRVPVDMAEKVIAAGIPTLVSKSLPTSDAVKLAQEYGLNLICRAWPDSFEIYSPPPDEG